ncbi:MAG: ATP-dependent 6-phosphofructokinase [Acidobacteria bacterium]|nr:ATP-dependent 6-phosphofructokinase [Acidobacteriota bacterium]
MASLGILTAGGDCPGLNAVIRAVTLRAAGRDMPVIGFENGFAGLVHDNSRTLDPRVCDDVLARGGSILGCSGSNPYTDPDATLAVSRMVERHDLSALIVVGGNTSMATAHAAELQGLPVVGVPKTIDNDVLGTEVTVGFATAVETATEAIDRLHTTAESHARVMIVETMGRDVGWLAATAGVAAGSTMVLVPEQPIQMEHLIDTLARRRARGHDYSIIVVGEGTLFAGESQPTGTPGALGEPLRLGGVGDRLAARIEQATDFSCRVSVLGHVLRGGVPCARDRVLATRLGIRAADLAMDGIHGIMVAWNSGQVTHCPLAQAASGLKIVSRELLDILDALSHAE